MGSRIAWRVVTLQLPFAGDAGVVAGILHEVTDGFCTRIEYSEITPVAVVIQTRHQLDARVGAQRLRVSVIKSDSLVR